MSGSSTRQQQPQHESCVCTSGYKLELDEVEQLLDQIDTAHTGQVAKSQLVASQIDWRATQQNHAEQWLASVQKVFQSFDTDRDGVIAYEQILECLRSKVPASEVRTAIPANQFCAVDLLLCFSCLSRDGQQLAEHVACLQVIIFDDMQLCMQLAVFGAGASCPSASNAGGAEA